MSAIFIMIVVGENMLQTMVILNPNAGRLTKKNRLAYYYQLISEYEHIEPYFFLTSEKTNAEEIVKKYHQDFDMIIAIGGDGTLNRVITGMMKTNSQLPIGYIPTGTTNDFARTHNILVSQKNALSIINQHEISMVDIGQFNNQYFSYVAAFGAYTSVAIKTSQKLKNMLGYYAYILTSFSHLHTLKNYAITIEINNEIIHEEVIFFAVANARSIGGLLNFTFDQVSLDDGYLDMVYIRYPHNPKDLVETLRALRKRDYNHPSIVLKHIEKVKITSKTPLLWSVDGEDGGDIYEVEISTLKNKLPIIKPKQ